MDASVAACIYCGCEASSREHWIPRGLGKFRGYSPLLDRLCKNCNECLGRELDEEFMRTGAIGFQRAVCGVQGRSGHAKVNPFLYRAMAGQQPTEMLMPMPHAGHLVLGEGYQDTDGNKSARPLRQIVVRAPDGRIARLPFPRAWTAEHLRTSVVERQLTDAEVVEVYFENDEGNPEAVKARAIVKEVFGSVREAVAFFGAGEREVKPIQVAAGITRKYIRAIAKTAFHYFLWTSPGVRGDEPAFADVRALIRHDAGDWRKLVQLDAPQFVPLFRGKERYVPRHTSHFFHSVLMSDAALAWVQFFVGPEDLAPPSKVLLAVRPLRITAKVLSCHQARYFDADEKGDGHDGEIIEIPCWDRKIILP